MCETSQATILWPTINVELIIYLWLSMVNVVNVSGSVVLLLNGNEYFTFCLSPLWVIRRGKVQHFLSSDESCI
jgi:hypothetical protein